MENLAEDRKLMCVLFPGVVKNEERAIQCLGGLKYMSQVYVNNVKKRLGLNFQPENIYMKRIYANLKKESGVLLKVKVKKKRDNNQVKREVISTSVLGRVNKVFKFDSLCDFQYMPIERDTPDGQFQCLLDCIPTGLDDFDFMKEPAPYCITPSNFTRADHPTPYSYTEKRYITGGLKEPSDEEGDLHSRVRKDRGLPPVKIEFNLVDEFPSEPHKHFIKAVEKHSAITPSLKEHKETVKRMFEERPIWSLNLIKYHSKIRHSLLKMLLPCYSFHMKNGPWRMLWIRYGYDPRKEPGARIYQLLDFRLRHAAGVHSMVMTRDQVANWRKADRVKHNTKKGPDDETLPPEEISESVVYFRQGIIPGQRQVFYMYCDIKIPEVEEILATEPPPGSLCHQIRGWLPHNTDHNVRDYIFKYVREAIFASHNTELQLERASSDDDSNSDDVDSSAEEPSTSNN